MREKLFDDIAGMVGGAAGLVADIRDQFRGDISDRLKVVADRIDLVTRDEVQALEDRIAALEALLKPRAVKTAPAPKAAPKKAAAKKKAAPKKKAKKARK